MESWTEKKFKFEIRPFYWGIATLSMNLHYVGIHRHTFTIISMPVACTVTL